VVIGATNLLDQLDPAAIREGRFDFKIEVPYPDEEARFAILKERVIKAGLTTHTETLQRLARRWSGFSVARMHAIVDEAARMGIDGTPADFDDFMAALRKVQGRKGARGEGGPTLEQLTLSPHMREVLEDIAGRMKNIEAIERLGGSLPRGVLFFGPPGTGKTFTARALANSADWAFLATTGHDLLANPKKIDEIMHEASDLRPCIVFIDEADDVFGHRSFSNAASITNKLLTAMDGANGRLQDVVSSPRPTIRTTLIPLRYVAVASPRRWNSNCLVARPCVITSRNGSTPRVHQSIRMSARKRLPISCWVIPSQR